MKGTIELGKKQNSKQNCTKIHSFIYQKTGSIKELCKIIYLPARLVTAGTVDLYCAVKINILPTPSKMLYQFSLHDISKVRDSGK